MRPSWAPSSTWARPWPRSSAAAAGYDWLIIDLEHGAATEADLLAQLYAVGVTPAAALVRPQSGERLRIGRALDLGADGVMVPRLDTAEQVREAVGYLRYPPAGARGRGAPDPRRRAGLARPRPRSARSTSGRSASSRSSPRRPSPRCDHIAAIDGVDVLFVGPTDLSHSLGVPGRFDDPTYLAALDTVRGRLRPARQVGRDPALRPGR